MAVPQPSVASPEEENTMLVELRAPLARISEVSSTASDAADGAASSDSRVEEEQEHPHVDNDATISAARLTDITGTSLGSVNEDDDADKEAEGLSGVAEEDIISFNPKPGKIGRILGDLSTTSLAALDSTTLAADASGNEAIVELKTQLAAKTTALEAESAARRAVEQALARMTQARDAAVTRISEQVSKQICITLQII
jgi:hypothetical protein